MAPQNLTGVLVFNRPIKPVALGFVILMGVLAYFNLSGTDVLKDELLSGGIGVLAIVAGVFLIIGWIGRSQLYAELGLLLAAAVYITRSVFLIMDQGFGTIGVWLGLGVSVIAAGAYLLETWDSEKGDT